MQASLTWTSIPKVLEMRNFGHTDTLVLIYCCWRQSWSISKGSIDCTMAPRGDFVLFGECDNSCEVLIVGWMDRILSRTHLCLLQQHSSFGSLFDKRFAVLSWMFSALAADSPVSPRTALSPAAAPLSPPSFSEVQGKIHRDLLMLLEK